jgi:imidazolonepropionase-like amidohydrolase
MEVPMRRVNSALVAATLGLGVLAGLAGSARADVTAFEGVRLIVGDGRVIENATLVIDGNKIAQAGQDVSVPAGATRVDLAGKTVMPTIIDTHVHLSPTRERLIRDLRMRGWYGVSAALSLGLDNYDLLDIRGQDIAGAARFFSAGRGITMPEPGRITAPHWITTEAEGRKAIQELAEKKVDIVKVWVDTRDNKFRKLSPELYGPIIDEAHKNNLRVTAHIFDLEDGKGLIRAGVDAFAHGVRDRPIDDEFLALWRQHPNLVLGPNLPDRGVKVDMSWMKAGVSPEEYEKLEKANVDNAVLAAFHGIQARNLAVMNKAGARIVLGTDGNRAWGPHEEMQDMVLAGMTPMEVIVAATRNGAEFLRMADAGTLEPGKSADFIVLDDNPLIDIANTRKIRSVVLRGVTLDRTQPVR